MPNDNQPESIKTFAPRILPWLLGLVMLVFFGITLNRWVTLANLMPVSKVCGYLWQPEYSNPLLFLATYPFRWLPAAQVPLALNVFSALCAAITLGLLARTVAILPHDRTEMERTRERSDFSFLTLQGAWFPPALAAVMLGLELGFWQHATNFTSEMVALLHFAVIVWLLAEYRLDERTGRLTLAALLYGAGLPDNWALIGFLPLFIAALIWLRRLAFFDLGFLGRMTLSGLAGMTSYLLMPLIGKLSGDGSRTFWEMLKPAFQLDWYVMKSVSLPDVRHNLMLMSITALVPLLVMSIRWSSSFGDASRMGTALANYLFHAVHAVIFTVCVWLMFDPPFSPSSLAMGLPALTLYFLIALALGYYCGYYLLVFGKKPVATRRNPNPLPALPGPLVKLSPAFYWATYAAGALIIFTLGYKNLPQIRALNDDTLLRYARWTEHNLPPGGGILLSDGMGATGQQARTLLIQAALARSGQSKDYLVVDAASLNWGPYLRHLHKTAPQKWPQLVGDKDIGLGPLAILNALSSLAKSNSLCYLNPSFGYYFEWFYQEPHGLVYEMKKLPEDTLLPPPPPAELVAKNNQFWAQVAGEEFDRIAKATVAYDATAHPNLPNWIIMHLHGKSEPNPNAVFAAGLYSRALDHWGVQLQRAGHLKAAAECFTNAVKLNPDNVAATISYEFNQSLQAGRPVTELDPNRATGDQFGKYRDWNALLNAAGPVDDPSFCLSIGFGFMNNTMNGYPLPLTHQAISEYSRVRELVPDNLAVRFTLAQLYLASRLPGPALEALQDAISNPRRFGLNETNSTGLNILAAAAHFQKNETERGIELMELELSRHPADMELLTASAQTYFMRGLYTNALRLIDRQLDKAPNDPKWLFGQGRAYLQMTNYDRAIAAFSRVLEISTNEPDARFNRAYAYLEAGRLADARADYAALQSAYTNAPPVAFGLGEVAWRLHDTNEAVRNYSIFLAGAPTNAPEAKFVQNRLKDLQKK